MSIIRSIREHRMEADRFFRSSPYSPFIADTSIHFQEIRWFPPTLDWYFQSKLYRYARPETVSIFGTKGEERRELRYGYFEIHHADNVARITVYKNVDSPGDGRSEPLMVWFTDETSNKETYGVGRYLEVGDEKADRNFLYTLDFNKAYNPYCAYSARYSCAIPRKEDHLNFAIRAGEMKYHK